MSQPFRTQACGPFGADLGRRMNPETALTGKVHLCRVPLDAGGYDPGGAYWGRGTRLYCAWNSEGAVRYLRAASREQAKRILRQNNMPGTFYR